MDAYSLDLRKKIVEAKERGMPTAEVAKPGASSSTAATEPRPNCNDKRSRKNMPES